MAIGSNSSYLADPNPNPPNVIGRWTCLDEVGTNNGESSNNMKKMLSQMVLDILQMEEQVQ